MRKRDVIFIEKQLQKSKNSVINKTLKVSSKQNKPVSLHYSKNYECYDKHLKDVNECKTLREKKEII